MNATDAKDAARRDVLESYGVIGAEASQDLQALVEIAAQVCGSSMAAINLIDHTHQHQVATTGVAPGVCTTDESMCARILDEPEPVRVADARLDDRFAANPFVTGEIADVRFYASSQLRTPQGVTVGSLCVFDNDTKNLTDEQFRTLNLLARQVVDVLELRRLSGELRRSNEQLSHFAGQISHDLRNPLAALSGLLELVADSPAMDSDAMAAHHLERASGSAHRMAEMIDELLSFAQIGGRPRPEDTDLSAVMAAVLDDLHLRVLETGATVVVDWLPMVHADRVQLPVVMQNLVANALKFTREDRTPQVHVAAARIGAGWRVTVDDNGPGIPAGLREKVFGIFERGTQSDVQGSGIGLSTCRQIIEAHGGAIGLDESHWGGVRAWFILPDAPTPEAADLADLADGVSGGAGPAARAS